MPTPLNVLEAIADAREANDDLKEYANEHKEIVDRYEELKAESESRTEAAKTALVANHESIDTNEVDGFRLSYPIRVNVAKLIELVPDVLDLEVLKTTITKKDYDTLVKQGVVSARAQVRIEEPAEKPTVYKPKW